MRLLHSHGARTSSALKGHPESDLAKITVPVVLFRSWKMCSLCVAKRDSRVKSSQNKSPTELELFMGAPESANPSDLTSEVSTLSIGRKAAPAWQLWQRCTFGLQPPRATLYRLQGAKDCNHLRYTSVHHEAHNLRSENTENRNPGNEIDMN